MRARFALVICFFGIAALRADEPVRVYGANYAQANKYSAAYLRQFTYDTSVRPNFIGKTDVFWYSFRTSQGTQFWRVDPKAAKKVPLFDRTNVAMQLSELLQKPVEATQLPISRGSVNDDGTKFKFVSGEWQFEYDLKGEKLTRLGKAPSMPATQRLPQNASEEERRRFFEQMRRRQEERRDDQEEKKDDQEEKKDEQQDQQRRGRFGRGFSGRPGDFRNMSPDKKAYLYVQKNNLYLIEIDGGKETPAVQLTKDGADDYTFSSFGGFGGRGRRGGEAQQQQGTSSPPSPDRKMRPNATWSKDGAMFYVSRSDSRGVKELFLVNSLATPRPEIRTYKYAMPGEESIRKTELYYGDRTSKKLTRVPPKWKDESYSDIHFGKTPDELRFVRTDRLRRHLEFCSLNLKTGEQKCLIAEGFEAAHLEFQPKRYLDDSDELIWWSERSGWAHYYLFERGGKLKNAITSGSFRASRIVDVDVKSRTMWFTGNGREAGENVYYQHLYSVKLDGSGLTLLDPGNAHHSSTLSPTKQFVVDNASRIDEAPHSVLRDAAGKKIIDLEKADLTRLRGVGWKLPETFVVKAADGVTDLYGNMWKPFDFSPTKKYPIITYVYPGPQQEGVTHTFSASSNYQQLAQLGFIVIQVGHRGGTPTRSKAYASFGYFNMRDYGLADKKCAIEQLAARHPWIDVDRVGIYGHSGGGFMSAAALLQKPYNEFFKAAVASAGNHDNNVYNNSWAERYHGLKEVVVKKEETKTSVAGATKTPPPKSKDGDRKTDGKNDKKGSPAEKDAVATAAAKKDDKKGASPIAFANTKFEIKVPTNAELAANLKGALLLVHGDMDNNVHPANTLRLVDALIKANKRFDMLMIPGASHGFGPAQPYFTQRMWDFFADHLLNHRSTSADIGDKTPRK